MAEPYRCHGFVRAICPQWQAQDATSPVVIKEPLGVYHGQTGDTSIPFRGMSRQPQMMTRKALAGSRSPTVEPPIDSLDLYRVFTDLIKILVEEPLILPTIRDLLVQPLFDKLTDFFFIYLCR